MKIKTAGLGIKTAPSPPPTPSPGTPSPASPCRRRRAPWSCCDKVLLGFIISFIVMFGAMSVFHVVGQKYFDRFHEFEDYEQYHPMKYERANCKVTDIIDQGQVCCDGKTCTTCEAGMKSSRKSVDWYRFMDDSSKTDHRPKMEEDDIMWEEMEEAEREALREERRLMEEMMEHGEKEEDMSNEEEDDDERERRSSSGREIQSFQCFKIVLLGWEPEPERGERRGSHSQESGHRSEESSEESSESGAHERFRRDDHKGHGGPRPDGHKSDEKPRDDMDKPDMDEPETQKDRPRPEEDENRSESGIIVANEETTFEGKEAYSAMFYDSIYTMENYAQCSYSACGRKACRNQEDIAAKIMKWRRRLASNEVFECAYADEKREDEWHGESDRESHSRESHSRESHSRESHSRESHSRESSEEHSGGWHSGHRRHGKIDLRCRFGFLIVAAVLFIILIIKRVRACMLMKQQCRLQQQSCDRYTVPDVVTVEEQGKTMTKEEEANLPSAPQMVWATETPPSYEKASELPPVYEDEKKLPPVDFGEEKKEMPQSDA